MSSTMNAQEIALQKWIPKDAELIEVTGTDVSSLTIEPELGYRHKIFDLNINFAEPAGAVSAAPWYDAVDIILGSKTISRYIGWLYGNTSADIQGIENYNSWSRFSTFSDVLADLNLLHLLWDAAEDEAITFNMVSGNSVELMKARYLKYKSADVSSHDVPGGSDYYQRLFFDWWSLLATSTGAGQMLTEGPMPYGQKLLGQNGRIPPTRQFEQYIIRTGYPNGNQNSGVTNFTEYSYLHEWDDDQELWTPLTHQGLYIDQQKSGFLTDTTTILDNSKLYKYTFKPNHLLGLYADVPSVTGSGSTLTAVLFGVLTDLSKAPAAPAAGGR